MTISTMSFRNLPSSLYLDTEIDSVAGIEAIVINTSLLKDLGPCTLATDDKALAKVLSGQKRMPGAPPLSMNYSGHQFGHFSPKLGDGRAALLAEASNSDGVIFDIHLKGSGKTPFSRRGDGKSSLGPVLREYLISEYFFTLGIPGTRALAAFSSSESVHREKLLTRGLLTRVSRGHIRFGTFENLISQGKVQDLKELADYSIKRISSSTISDEDPYNDFFLHIAHSTLELVASWMSIGFIHGVMNTDNMSIFGETLDFGPCAFQDDFSESKVFSSIDHHGRYAYNNQSKIAIWNLTVLANALFPLLVKPNETNEVAAERLKESINLLEAYYQKSYLQKMTKKLGIKNPRPSDIDLVESFLGKLQEEKSDFTNSFRNLFKFLEPHQDLRARIQNRWSEEGTTDEALNEVIHKVNPFIIPRNHLIEEVIKSAYQGDLAPFHRLHSALQHPFEETEENRTFSRPPLDHQVVHKTFCGT